MERTFFLIASLLGGLSVALGTFARAHVSDRLDAGMFGQLPDRRHLYVLSRAGLVCRRAGAEQVAGQQFTALGRLALCGVFFFWGSLFLMAFTGQRWPLGAITPIGGVAFIAGWLLLAIAA